MTTLRRGDRAPLLVGLTLDGQPYLEQPEGRLTVLVFFKESCPTCRLILPRLENLHRAYPSSDWRLLGIGQDPLPILQSFAQELRLSFPILADHHFSSSAAYRLTHVPTTFVIDPQGQILHVTVGFVRDDLEAISQQIARRLKVPFHPIASDEDPAFRPG
ncbi:Sporulation thiol-disulfide oxidoreductase A [Candidatus Thermoflexus japonica]|uniref:Sporulation thiol-disulfide oxidoreductase A n=1 Tax=Candidatus Thermoflexus japonica TaxID=2035417 RepID=A0A2H5YA93_9CHLR|nr:Sporulation thiol-disulfide oxidoreductase A [Candidatus Thermoflexus japonica]